MKRVLFVDDERDVADALAEIFEGQYEVCVAYDGAEALQRLEAGGIDAVVLDLMMPVMSGERLLAELQSRGMAMKVILASAATDLRERALRSKANDFICKPFSPDVLERKLIQLLGTGGPDGSSNPGGKTSVSGGPPPHGGQDASRVSRTPRASSRRRVEVRA